MKVGDDGFTFASIVRNAGAAGVEAVIKKAGAAKSDTIFLMAGPEEATLNLLGSLRLELAKKENWIPSGKWNMSWIVDFPLLQFDSAENRWVSRHHPFTSPVDEDLQLLETHPERIRAKAYDLVLNGTEIGGGPIRIHRSDIQSRVFNVLGFTPQEIRDKFGFFFQTLEFCTPPNGGIALGLVRLVIILRGQSSIREVIE